MGVSYGENTILRGSYGVGGQRTVDGKGMGLNIWGIDRKDGFLFPIW